MSQQDWKRVSPTSPCPICARPDWCLLARDGTAAICARIESPNPVGHRGAGWLHRLADQDLKPRPAHVRKITIPLLRGDRDFGELARKHAERVAPAEPERFAAQLGVKVETLRRLGLGWDGAAWTFPMSDARGEVIGIRRRLPDGRKLAVRGSRQGLFVPSNISSNEVLLTCEGPTDTAAALSLGFAAVGRPSCSGGADLLCEFARGRDVVIVADRDLPGERGASSLAQVLRIYCPSIRMIRPPNGVKDLRAWVRNGATHTDILRRINEATSLKLRIIMRPNDGP